MECCIRDAEAKDRKALLFLIKEHALFEGHEQEVFIRHQQLCNFELFPLTIFVVESNNKLVGYMSVIKQFSTWEMDWYLYLDCLYLSREARGQGIGLKLMQKLRLFSQENNLSTIQWQTPKDNFVAIKFYQKLGAINKEKQRFFWPI
jgi:ribosomal protein S18 acetylase RimI-like enzyme